MNQPQVIMRNLYTGSIGGQAKRCRLCIIDAVGNTYPLPVTWCPFEYPHTWIAFEEDRWDCSVK